jgi:hypothetical protein
LNLSVELYEKGILEKYGVKLIGANIDAIKVGEDRELFKKAMDEIGIPSAKGGFAHSWEEARAIVEETGYPAIVRPAFTLGGTGGGTAYNPEEFEEIARNGLEASPVTQILVEESILGWKEYELEVMRDLNDNVVIICSIENFDPMGVHTGDSITVAPAQTLTDVEYQQLRDMSIACIRKVGVETGGSNIQFRGESRDGDCRIIEMNPARVRVRLRSHRKRPDFRSQRSRRSSLSATRSTRFRTTSRRKTRRRSSRRSITSLQKFRSGRSRNSRSRGRSRHADEVRRRGDGDRPTFKEKFVSRDLRSLEPVKAACGLSMCRMKSCSESCTSELAAIFVHHIALAERLLDRRGPSTDEDRSVVSRSAFAGDGVSGDARRETARRYTDDEIRIAKEYGLSDRRLSF